MTEGYLDAIKDALVTHISESDSSLSPATTHVLPNLNEDVWKYDTTNLPIVTVRIGPSVDMENFQGRQLGGNKMGIHVKIFFTAVLFHNVNETENEDKNKTAMQLAELIKENLLRSDDSTSGICYYSDVTIRESLSGMANVSKMIIEGYVFARRPFNI